MSHLSIADYFDLDHCYSDRFASSVASFGIVTFVGIVGTAGSVEVSFVDQTGSLEPFRMEVVHLPQ